MTTVGLARQIDGFEWRTLLGPTHRWPTPATSFTGVSQEAMGRCELCGETVGDGRPFITDSAGQTPVHVACSDGKDPLALERQQAGLWHHLLLLFAKH
jgi:hypothetical protein